MKPILCKAGQQLRLQVDDCYPSRLRDSDGWVADLRHMREGKSDHIPDGDATVFAIDIDRDLAGKAKPDLMPDLADQIRICAKRGDSRIKYVIFDSKICSPILNWKWRAYKGANKHTHHAHVSFTAKGKEDGSFFNIPMLGGTL
jgi:hypothetical protein